ncbi:MAG: hypothetical protein EOO74_08850 [Myxococcales bacterium]|nr:MAG: hypothetical protein EOO74_08850 [Myxococcales bacterium]
MTIFKNNAGQLGAGLAGIASWAVEGSSTPSGAKFMGFEVDPTLVYQSNDGVTVSLEHAVFLPGAAFDNVPARLPARPAQLIRARLMLRF